MTAIVLKILRTVFRLAKWSLIAIVVVEVVSFVVVVSSNFVLYGSRFEGSRARYDAYALFLHREGPRATAFNRRSGVPSRDRLLWILGGSTTRGSTDDDAKTIPSFLSHDLNRDAEGLCWTVRNFGVNSFNSLLQAKYLQKLLIEESEKPDLVIFLDGANDATYYATFRTPEAHFGYSKVRGIIESYRNRWFGILKPIYAAAYASYTRELLEKITQTMTCIPQNSPELRAFADSVTRRYDFLDRLCRSLGIEFVVFWQPTRWVETAPAAPAIRDMERRGVISADRLPAYAHNMRAISDAVIARAGSLDCFVDFRNVLTSRTSLVYREDGVHFLDEGRELVAKTIAAAIGERKLTGKAK
ncbi:MAG: SGNH/GDSL hydrolase family protein [Verrucomicrobia bacterium]|nr:SGNH/GDSL hydrolase family protein [Verrucomicrobiota bacterium]